MITTAYSAATTKY